MTESAFPFDGPAVDTAADEAQNGGSRTKLLVLGGVAALALGAGGYLLIGGAGDAEEDFSIPPAGTGTAAPAEVEAPVVEVVPAAATEVVGRNPFKARYVAPSEAAPAVSASDPGPAPDLSGGFTMTPDGSGGVVVKPGNGGSPSVPSTGGSTGGTTGAPPQAPASSEVVLLGGEDKDGGLAAVFTVDGQRTVVKVGETFGSRKQVLLVSLHEGPGPGQWTAVLRVGDAPPKDIISGEKIHVTN